MNLNREGNLQLGNHLSICLNIVHTRWPVTRTSRCLLTANRKSGNKRRNMSGLALVTNHIKVALQLLVGRSVCLGIEAQDHILSIVKTMGWTIFPKI
jgi:hypothetical protein